MRDFFQFLFVCVIALVCFFGLAIGIATTIEYVDCNAYGRATNQAVKFDWGCYVEVENKWYPKQTVVAKTVIIK